MLITKANQERIQELLDKGVYADEASFNADLAMWLSPERVKVSDEVLAKLEEAQKSYKEGRFSRYASTEEAMASILPEVFGEVKSS